MNITEVLQKYVQAHKLESSKNDVIRHAAKYFYFPGMNQHTPPEYALEAINAAIAASKSGAEAPDWLLKALACTERHPPA